MQICRFDETVKFEDGVCKFFEYEKIIDSDINAGIVIINDRYPKSGLVMNLECKEMIYVISGNGKFVINNNKYDLTIGTTILINPNEKYYFIGNDLKLFMPCTPAWKKEQHIFIEEE